MASQLTRPVWQEWVAKHLDGASPRAEAFPANRFYCLLDELPLHLIPQWFFKTKPFAMPEAPLVLNPDCLICQPGELPAEISSQQELLAGFALQGTIAWVCDPVSSSLLPFWLGPRLEAAVSRLQRDDVLPESLPEEDRFLLASAGILVAENHKQARLQEWESVLHSASLAIRDKGYAPVSNLVHPFHLAALRRYYRSLIRQGNLTLGDSGSSRRYVGHNESVARFFHHQLTRVVRAIAGEEIKPSYVYAASYLTGAELKKHTDREQCEFSVTLCLDFSPEPAMETSWPIRLEISERGAVFIYQALGDGLVYRGTRLPHSRYVLTGNRTSTVSV